MISDILQVLLSALSSVLGWFVSLVSAVDAVDFYVAGIFVYTVYRLIIYPLLGSYLGDE